MVEACATCQWHHPQELQQPLQPTSAPEHPWQHIGADFFSFNGFGYLVIVDYYPKMPFISRIPHSQCNVTKTILVLKELFSDHGIPETLRSDNGPSLPVTCLQNLLGSGSFTTPPTHPETPESMVKQKNLLWSSKACLPEQNTQGKILILH